MHGQDLRRPPGYPAELAVDVRLADGRVVHVRPVVPGDADRLRRDVMAGLPAGVADRLVGPACGGVAGDPDRVDYRSRLALVAEAGDVLVGVARYDAHAGSWVAEAAVAVAPAWRRTGVAAELLRRLARAAAARGITTMTACFAADDPAAPRLLRASRLPAEVRQLGDATEVVVDLRAVAPEAPPDFCVDWALERSEVH